MKTSKLFKNAAKALCMAAVVSMTMTSCLGDGDSSYCTIYGTGTDCYANSTTAYLIFQSSSDWKLAKGSDSPWLSIKEPTGKGPVSGYAFLTTNENMNKEYRYATINIQNIDGKSSSAIIYQWGTRGDGSLGTAKDVKRITGTDGSDINLGYDMNHRVRQLTIKKGNTTLEELRFMYSIVDTTRTLTVYTNDNICTATVNFGYQPITDIASEDKAEVFSWEGNTSGTQVTVTRIKKSNKQNSQLVSLSGYKNPDSELSHSRVTFSYNQNGSMVDEYLNIKHEGKLSNRYQSVDANQLIYGVERMNPYVFAGLCRYARCSYLYEEAESTSGVMSKYKMEYALNSDYSVHTMTVTREDGSTVTYTFEY